MHWGVYRARLENGIAISLEPFERDPNPSPIGLGRALIDARTSPARILRPAVRTSFLERGHMAGGEGRGGEPFVEVEWEQALDLVAGELKRVIDTYGNRAIYGNSSGWASAGRFHHAGQQVHRLLNCIGGFVRGVGNYSFGAADVILPHVFGTTRGLVSGHTPWRLLAGHAKLIVMFGGAPVRNGQMSNGGIARHGIRDGLLACRDGGAKFVSISPIRDDALDTLGADWIAPRPNTDVALMLGVAHVLITEKLADEAFLARYTMGFERLRAYVLGEGDGTPKSPEWAAAITALDADAIRDLARRMAREKAFLMLTWSLQRADHGEQPYWMAAALAAMIGGIGTAGSGIGFGYGSSGAIGGATPSANWPTLPQGRNPIEAFIPVSRISDMLLNPGQPFDFNGKRYTFPDVRLVYWAGGNPFHHQQNINKLLTAWRKPEAIIVHESFWNAHARHADIVLPAAVSLERNDIAASGRDGFLSACQKLFDPAGQARTDHDILRGVARRFGVEDKFTEGREEADWLRHLYEEARGKAMGATMPEFDQFWRDGLIELPEIEDDKLEPLLGALRADPDKNRLQTPSGRIEIGSERIASFGYDDCPGHPAWLEPVEWLGSPIAARYPLHLLSNQPSRRLHSQYDHAPHARAGKIKGREPIRLNPKDAAARGIAAGDLVRVFNDRGSLISAAVIDEALRESVVQLSTGAWFDPAEPGKIGSIDKHGNPNVLTVDKGTSRLAQAPSVNSCLVEIERLDGDSPEVTVFEPPPL
jgi:biotin/methionine sulfoxide reductase